MESTNGSLSQFHGPEVVMDDPESTVQLKVCTLNPEETSWSTRDYLVYNDKLGTSSGATSALVNIEDALIHSNMAAIRTRYRWMSWDSISVRITSSDPKTSMGGFYVTCSPYNNAVPSTAIQASNWTAYLQSMWSLPERSYYKSFGAPGDITFEYPWSYRTPVLSTTVFQSFTFSRPGMPVTLLCVENQNYIGTIFNDPEFKVYVKFNGLKFYAPIYLAQSGLMGNLASTLAGNIAAQGVVYLSDLAYDRYGVKLPNVANTVGGSVKQGVGDYMKNDYSNPVETLPTYFGDTIDGRVSHKMPIRQRDHDFIMHPQRPIADISLLSFLKRPQFIGTFTGTNKFTNRVAGFREVNANRGSTWFGYFSRIARYWTGDVIFDIVVNGHSTVECELTVKTLFGSLYRVLPLPGGTATQSESFGAVKNDEFTFQGPKTFSFLCPLAAPVEYMNMVNDDGLWTTELIVSLSTTSTMFTLGTVTYSVFVRAADNFRFLDPMSPSSNAIYSQANIHPECVDMNPISSDLKRGGVLEEINTFRDVLGKWSGVNFSNSSDDLTGYYPGIKMLDGLGLCDFVAWMMNLYLFRRGSISHKVVCGNVPGRLVAGVALGDAALTTVPNIVIDRPTSQQPPIPTFLDPGKGAVFTNTSFQPMLEYTLPYRGNNTYGFNHAANDQLQLNGSQRPDPGVDSNIQFFSPVGAVSYAMPDRLYRKVAQDFSFAVEILPLSPIYWYGY